MIQFKHKHIYVYKFPLSRKEGGFIEHTYTLCTDHDDPNSKANRMLLENMLRVVYKHMPKGVKFAYEKK